MLRLRKPIFQATGSSFNKKTMLLLTLLGAFVHDLERISVSRVADFGIDLHFMSQSSARTDIPKRRLSVSNKPNGLLTQKPASLFQPISLQRAWNNSCQFSESPR